MVTEEFKGSRTAPPCEMRSGKDQRSQDGSVRKILQDIEKTFVLLLTTLHEKRQPLKQAQSRSVCGCEGLILQISSC